MRTGPGIRPRGTECAGSQGRCPGLLTTAGGATAPEVLPGLEQARPGEILDDYRACHLLPVRLREAVVEIPAVEARRRALLEPDGIQLPTVGGPGMGRQDYFVECLVARDAQVRQRDLVRAPDALHGSRPVLHQLNVTVRVDIPRLLRVDAKGATRDRRLQTQQQVLVARTGQVVARRPVRNEVSPGDAGSDQDVLRI